VSKRAAAPGASPAALPAGSGIRGAGADWTPVRRRLTLAALAALWACLCGLCWPYTMDDAYISLRYASHLARGLGFSWNPGGPPVEGFSNFLWVLWMAAASFVSGDPMAATKLLGAILGLGVVAQLAREGRETLGSGGWGLFPAACLASSPMFAFWSVSGIEAPAAALAVLAGWRGLRLGRPVAAGLGFAALALLRPEGLPLAAVGIGGAFLLAGSRAGRRAALAAGGLVAAAATPYLLWRLARFGSPVANTVAAKWMPFGGLAYFLGDLVRLEGVHLAFAVGAVAAVLSGRAAVAKAPDAVRDGGGPAGRAGGAGTGGAFVLAGAIVAAQALVLLNTRPAMGFYLRLFWPVLPLVLLLSGASLARLAAAIRPAWLVTVPAAALAVFPLVRDMAPVRLPTAPAAAPVRRTAVAVGEILATVHGPLADWVRANHPQATVALTDCGLLPWASDASIIDLWGLNDPEIARSGFDPDRVLARQPDLLVLASRSATEFAPRFAMDGALQAHPVVARDYRRVRTFTWSNDVDGSGDYSLWVYERNR